MVVTVLEARWVLYDALGARLAAVPEPLAYEASVNRWDVGSFRLTYSARAAQGPLFDRPLTDGTEVALEVNIGDGWVEPAGGRFILTDRTSDVLDDADVRVCSGPSYDWNLSKIRDLNAGARNPVGSDEEGKRTWAGVTPGHLVDTMLTEAAALGLEPFTWTFTDAVDSNGDPWDRTLTWHEPGGVSLDVLVQKLCQSALAEYEMRGRELVLTNLGGLTIDRQKTAVYDNGLHVTTAPTQESIADLAARYVLTGGDSVDVSHVEATAPTPWGAWQWHASDSSLTDTGSIKGLLQAEALRSGRVVGQFVRDLANPATVAEWPLLDYGCGAWIKAPADIEGDRVRVQQIIIRDNGANPPILSLVLNDRFLDYDERRRRYRAGIIGGSGGGDGGGSTIPPKPGTPDTRRPAAPTGLVVSSAAYIDAGGQARGTIHAAWAPVSTARAADGGGPMAIAGYNLYARPAGDTFWRSVAATEGLTAEDSPYDVGSEWEFAVQARPEFGRFPGDLSDVVTVTIADDTTPPPLPSSPTEVRWLGVPSALWDGKTGTGTPMPPDFRHLRVWASLSPAAPAVDVPDADCYELRTSPGPTLIFGGFAVGDTVHVRYQAVDRSGNASAWTAAVPMAIETLPELGDMQDAIDDLVNNVIPGIEGDITVASGKFTGSTSAPTPADGDGKPVGAIWNQYDGTALLGSWYWTGTAWEPREPQQVHIDTGTFGVLDGIRIKAHTILTEHLAIGDFTNQLDNPNTDVGVGGWGVDPVPITPHPTGGTGALQVTADGTLKFGGANRWVPVKEGDQSRFEALVRRVGFAAGTGNVTIGVATRDASGTTTGLYAIASIPVTGMPSTWQTLAGDGTAPAGTVEMRMEWWVDAAVTLGDFQATAFSMRRKTGGVLIEDGAVTAPKIYAGSVQAQHLEAVMVLTSRVVATNGGPANQARVEMNPSGFQSFDYTAEAGAWQTTHMGPGVQALELSDLDGPYFAANREDGVVAEKGNFAQDLVVADRSLLGIGTDGAPTPDSWLWNLPWGVGFGYGGRGDIATATNFSSITSATRALAHVDVMLKAGRMYRVSLSDAPIDVVPSGVDVRTRIRPALTYRFTTDGTEPPNPTPDSTQMTASGQFPSTGNTSERFGVDCAMTAIFEPPQDRRIKVAVILGVENATATLRDLTSLGTWRLMVEDMGPSTPDVAVNNTSVPGGSAPGTPTKRTYTMRWKCDGVNNYQGTISSPPSGGANRMGQGKVASMSAGPRHSVARFTGTSIAGSTVTGQTITTALSGVPNSDIEYIEVRGIRNLRSVNTSVAALIGTQSSYGATPSTTSTSPKAPRGGGSVAKRLGSTEINAINSSGHRYISFGPGANVNNTHYAEFAGLGSLELVIRYKKTG